MCPQRIRQYVISLSERLIHRLCSDFPHCLVLGVTLYVNGKIDKHKLIATGQYDMERKVIVTAYGPTAIHVSFNDGEYARDP